MIKPIGSTAVPEGGSFTFSLSITDGYKKGKNFAVKAGDVVLKPDPPVPAAGEGATADTKKSENGSGENAGENTNTGENAQNQSAENQPAATGKEPAAGTAGTGSGAAGRESSRPGDLYDSEDHGKCNCDRDRCGKNRQIRTGSRIR